MATGITSYPASLDTFQVPDAPSTTPLSQAGTGNSRSHVNLHADVGAAVMALELNASQITHVHDGTGIQGAQLSQVNTHQNSDTDKFTNSIHHTIDPTQKSSTQSAAANHIHSQYVDLTTNQTILAKKTFPNDNTNSIAISNFTNSQHNHLSPNGGGMAAGSGFVWPLLSSGNWKTAPVNTTQDNLISNQGFTIPAGMAVIGTIFISYLVVANVPYSNSNNAIHQAYHYLSLNQPGDTAIWVSSKNILLTTNTLNGNVVESDFYFNGQASYASSSGPQQFRANVPLGFYIPASSSDRPTSKLGYRIVNNGNTTIQQVSWSGYSTFMSSNAVLS